MRSLQVEPHPASERPFLNRKGRNQAGASKIGMLLTVIIFGAFVYLAFQVANFYYCFYEIEGLMQFQGKKAQEFSDAEIRQTVFTRIKELEIPIEDPEKIAINRVDGKIIIESRYDEVLFVEFRGKQYDIHVFHFRPHVEVKY